MPARYQVFNKRVNKKFAKSSAGASLPAVKPDLGFKQRLAHVIARAGGPGVVSRAVGVTPQAVYGWLAGSRPYPQTISKLCLKLGVSKAWLIDETGDEEASGADDDAASPRVEEESPQTKDDATLADSLAEMIARFRELPAPFQRLVLATIDEHYIEFRRRAQILPPARVREGGSYSKHRP